MHATPTVKHGRGSDVRITFVIIAMLGLLTVGTVIIMIGRSDDASTSAPTTALTEKRALNFWFTEMNRLPETSGAKTPGYDRQSFIELNRLPEASIAQRMTYQQYRFLEFNALPESAPAPIVTFERWRFLEFNALPGGNAPFVAPSSNQRGVPY